VLNFVRRIRDPELQLLTFIPKEPSSVPIVAICKDLDIPPREFYDRLKKLKDRGYNIGVNKETKKVFLRHEGADIALADAEVYLENEETPG
jgi:DNA-binding Lrp family transcriptional regulator